MKDVGGGPDWCHGERGSESRVGDAARRLRDGVKAGVVGDESGCGGWKKTPWLAAMVGVNGCALRSGTSYVYEVVGDNMRGHMRSK